MENEAQTKINQNFLSSTPWGKEECAFEKHRDVERWENNRPHDWALGNPNTPRLAMSG